MEGKRSVSRLLILQIIIPAVLLTVSCTQPSSQINGHSQSSLQSPGEDAVEIITPATIRIQPEAGAVHHNRVDAFILAHDYLDLLKTASEDHLIDETELIRLNQAAANASASLYSTGDHQVFDYAHSLREITDYLNTGNWEKAEELSFNLSRQLPRRPYSGK